MSKHEVTRAIDVLAKAMPNGQLMAALGPLAFLGAAAERIKELERALRDARSIARAANGSQDENDFLAIVRIVEAVVGGTP
jgi:hypothetical protein